MTKPRKKPTAKPGGRLGRKPVEMGIVEVEKLARLNCTMEEIAAYFGVDRRSITARMQSDEQFAAAVERGRDYGKLSVRRAQMQLAAKGNPAMLIWLGKQLLGQREPRFDAIITADISTTNRVMVVPSHGTDDQWEQDLVTQQAALIERAN